MAAPNKQDDNAKNNKNIELRAALSSAYASIEGSKAVQSFTATTVEDCLQEQIDRIEGGGTSTRPTELIKIQNIKTDLLSAVDQIKNLPAEAYALPNETDRSVNTPASSQMQKKSK